MPQRDKGLAGPHQSGHFETVYFFYLDLGGRVLELHRRAVSKRCVFGERIHWFRVNDRSIRLRNYIRFKKCPYLCGRGLRIPVWQKNCKMIT